MDIMVGFLRTIRKHYAIWFIVDRVTKYANFRPLKVNYLAEDYDLLYIKEIVKLHGAPLSIIFDRGTQFTSNYLKAFKSLSGTKVKLSTDFHHKTDGQA